MDNGESRHFAGKASDRVVVRFSGTVSNQPFADGATSPWDVQVFPYHLEVNPNFINKFIAFYRCTAVTSGAAEISIRPMKIVCRCPIHTTNWSKLDTFQNLRIFKFQLSINPSHIVHGVSNQTDPCCIRFLTIKAI